MAKDLKATALLMLRSGKTHGGMKTSQNRGEAKKRLVIRVSFLDSQKQWSLSDIKLSRTDFQKLININSKLTTQELKDLQIQLLSYNAKAINICNELGSNFTFDRFEEMFFNNRQVRNSNMKVLDVYELYVSKREGIREVQTLRGYGVLRNHIIKYDSGLRLNQIDKEFPNKFMKYLISKGVSEPTGGVYLRYMRSLYNFAVEQRIIKDDVRPFLGFKIPNTRRRKLALPEEILKQLKYYTPSCVKQAMALDMFWLSFECSGINFKDLALLKYSELDGNMIIYYRQKIKNSKADDRRFTVNNLTKRGIQTIEKWGNKKVNDTDYIFPFNNNAITNVDIQKNVDQLIENTNKQLAIISKDLNLPIKITTNYARHSYATFLQSNGFTTEQIGDKLQHYGDLKTTKIYMASFQTVINCNIQNLIEAI